MRFMTREKESRERTKRSCSNFSPLLKTIKRRILMALVSDSAYVEPWLNSSMVLLILSRNLAEVRSSCSHLSCQFAMSCLIWMRLIMTKMKPICLFREHEVKASCSSITFWTSPNRQIRIIRVRFAKAGKFC